MKETLKVVGWIQIVLGSLAVLGVLLEPDADAIYGLFGGFLFLIAGWVALQYIKENK